MARTAVSLRALMTLGGVLVATVCGAAESGASQDRSPPRPVSAGVVWNERWPRVGIADYAIASGSLVTALAVQFGTEVPEDPRWTGRNAVDDGVRDLFRLGSPEGRNSAAAVSNPMFYGLTVYPIVVDALAVTLIGHGNPDVAWQTFVMDLEAIGLATLFARLGQRLGGRERPFQIACRKEGEDSHKFCPGTAESFISGHVAVPFAAAAVTCVHHANLPLYGGWGDDAVCYGTLGLSTVVASLRLNGDMHWFSDVVLGAALGAGAGYLLPQLLHYGAERANGLDGYLLPLVTHDRIGARYLARF